MTDRVSEPVSERVPAEPLLVVEGLLKSFHRVRAVEDVSFTVTPGEIVGLVGPNGAGKSTTMAMIAGELMPDQGRIRVGPHEVFEAPVEARRAFGYVPQGLRLFPFLTGDELLALVGEVKGISPEALAEEVETLLGALDLLEARDRLSREYSEGMARKLAFAAAVLGRPPLLLLDESLNGLDPRAAFAVKALLRQHAKDGGAVLIASHGLETLERLCTRILLVHRGRVLDDLDRTQLDALNAAGRTLEDHFLDRTAEE